LVLASLLLALPTQAHHSSAYYDLDRPRTFAGIVTRYEWAHPHVYLYVETEVDTGGTVIWEIEASPPSFMTLRGWSSSTFSPGDRVVVEGYAAKDPDRRMALGVSALTADGTRLVMSRNSPRIGNAEADPVFRPPTDTTPADSLSGKWLGVPPNRKLARQFLFEAQAWALTPAGISAFESYDGRTNPAADCIAYTAPFTMALPDLKIIEISETLTTIVSGLDNAERRVHMDVASHDGAEYSNQGHSIGRWEGRTLVVDTARFESRQSGNAFALPSSRLKHLVERFELSDDRMHVNYSFVLTDPEFLAEPLRDELQWTHSPNSELTGSECDLENARRYLAGWPE
jgi:hypothetical protein